MVLPENTFCIITAPITLDIASNHGVVVASETGSSNAISSVSLVDNLLQKPTVEELVENQALLDDGRTLLDTGIIAVRGKAWVELVKLACSSQSLIQELLDNKQEMSLYEDLVAAWVPKKHEWLKKRPLGTELLNKLGNQQMVSYCANELLFLHFGTSSEVLDYLSGTDSRLVGRRRLCSIPATTASDIAASTVVLSSKIAPGVSVENLLDSSLDTRHLPHELSKLEPRPEKQNLPRTVKVELPVRVDFVGGWSDTPPWSLKRAGCVLNMAMCLEDSLPIGTVINTTTTSGVSISDDDANELFIEDLTSIAPPFEHDDPFRLVKCSLLVTGVIHDKTLKHMGLKIKTWANVPRGSGLGTSSILVAAVVKGLTQIIDGDDGNENVARLVLVLEQLMGTGGGWQDQIGGLYPGIKFTTSFPGIPLRLQVIPLLVSSELKVELQQRLLVVFTGQVRLTRKVLQNVVTRYLRRDNLLVSSIKRLAELAKLGREALMNTDIDELGNIMIFDLAEPYSCGYKLVGAGGGRFAMLLANYSDSAVKLRQLLTDSLEVDVNVYNWSIFLEQ